jgi:hypothetical protein
LVEVARQEIEDLSPKPMTVDIVEDHGVILGHALSLSHQVCSKYSSACDSKIRENPECVCFT